MKITIHKDINCKLCKKKDKKHHARGYCKACYLKQLRAKWREEKESTGKMLHSEA